MSAIIEYDVPLQAVICNNCKHYHRDDWVNISCNAFDQIPQDIISSRNDHTKPLPGQKNKIVYEPKNA